MPIVIVYLAEEYTDDNIDIEVTHAINRVIREFGSQTFRLENGTPLSFGDFSVIFEVVSEHSSIAYDIIVCMHLNGSDERVLDGLPDQHAEKLAAALKEALEELNIEASIGVALLHSVMGWATATVAEPVPIWPGDR